MTPDELARLEHENFIEAFAVAVAGTAHPLVERRDGVAIVASGLPLRLFNEVLVEDDDADPAAIAAGVEMLRARGDRFVLNLRVGTDDRFIEVARDLGLVPMDATPWLPGMAWFPLEASDPAPADAAPGHVVRHVTDVAGIEDHIRTAGEAFGMPEAMVREIMTVAMLEQPHVAVYVGYTDGQPVSTGMGCRTGRTIGVYNISTIESARRRGYGEAMTARVVADGAAAGCDVAILQASEMGAPIYERLGFRTVVEYMGYIDPVPDPVPGRDGGVSPAG